MPSRENGPPRGTRDLMPEAVARREAVIAELAASYGRFGYRRIETPSIEDISRLTWGEGGDNEKLIYRILRRGLPSEVDAGTQLSELVDLGLRYDLTVPLTRFYAEHAGVLPTPFRAMQIGYVWRAERPQRGRYRQFTQCDIDIIGEPSVLAECELLEASLAAYEAIGISPVHARVNDRRILRAIAAESGVTSGSEGEFFVVLDRVERDGWAAVKEEMASRGLGEDVGERCEWLVTLLQGAETTDELLGRAADRLPQLEESVLEDLRQTAASLAVLDAERGGESGFSWSLDPTVVRGMGYYTGQIFEIAHAGSAGSVGGGGRYDGLVGRSLGREVPACGFSIGFDRVVELADFGPPDLGVAVLYSDQPIPAVLSVARRLRSGGRTVGLVRRRGQMRRQLDELKSEGYSSFVSLESGRGGDSESSADGSEDALPEVRPLS